MRKVLLALALLIVNAAANASAWTGESHGTLCIGSSCDNSAPSAPNTTAGRVLLIYTAISGGGTARTLATPSGWTRIDPTTTDSDLYLNERVFCRVATGGDTMPTLDWNVAGYTVVMQAVSFSGPALPNCTTIVHASSAGTDFGSTWPSQSVTITHNNTLVFEFGIKLAGEPGVTFGSISCPSDVNTGQFANDHQAIDDWPQVAGCYRIETTATSVSSSNPFTASAQSTAEWTSVALSLEQQEPIGGSFSAGPTWAASGTTTYQVTFTATNGATVKCGVWLYGTVPSASDVNTGTNAHGTNSLTANGSSQNLTVTVSDGTPAPLYDGYCTADGGSTKTSQARTFLTPAGGKQFVQLGSVTTVGSIPKAFNDGLFKTVPYDTQTVNFTVGKFIRDTTSGAYGFIIADNDGGATGTLTLDIRSGTFSDNDVLLDSAGGTALVNGSASAVAAIAVSDVLVVPTTVSPSGATLTVDTNGHYNYTAAGRQTALGGQVYDVSAQAYMATALNLDVYLNNSMPSCAPTKDIVYVRNVAASTVDLDNYCADADVETVASGVLSGSLPTGLALNGSTNVISGTPTVNTAVSDVFAVYDAALALMTQTLNLTVTDGWAMPDCTSSVTSSGACVNSIISLTSGGVTVTQTPKCDSRVAPFNVLSTSPRAGANIRPGDNVGVTSAYAQCSTQPVPMVSCLRQTVSACQTLVNTSFPTGVTVIAVSQTCPGGYSSGKIISQSPRRGSPVTTPVTLVVNYCQ
jgi:hypothetical protein